jgi:hypothetical protein
VIAHNAARAVAADIAQLPDTTATVPILVQLAAR